MAAFAAIAAVLVVTPGVGTAFLVSTVISHGRRAGYLAAAGMVLGGIIYALAAAVGTTVLLRAFPRSLDWIAVGGGAFIVWLGAKGIFRAFGPAPADSAVVEPPGRHEFITTGVIIALGNAPLPLFYLVVVPQYAPDTMTPFGGAMLLSGIHLAMAATWMVTLVTLVGHLVHVLRRRRVRLTMQVLTGVALIYLGIKSITGTL